MEATKVKRSPAGIRLLELEKKMLQDLTKAYGLRGERTQSAIVGELIQNEHKRLVPEKWDGSAYIG